MNQTGYTPAHLRIALLFLFSIPLFTITGCGEPTGTVSGTVTFKDKPVTGGTVIFVTDDDKRQERVEIQPDGTYSSKKVPVGNCRVAVQPAPKDVSSLMPKGAKMPKDMPEGTPGKDVYGKKGSAYVDIPEELRDPKTSNITFTVNRGEQEFKIALKAAK